MLRYLTAGESHGPQLTAIIDGLPAGLPIDPAQLDFQLARRQKGYGRGGRMKIETDKAQILSGIRHGRTIGSPITIAIKNKDWENWAQIMDPVNPIPIELNLKLKRLAFETTHRTSRPCRSSGGDKVESSRSSKRPRARFSPRDGRTRCGRVTGATTARAFPRGICLSRCADWRGRTDQTG